MNIEITKTDTFIEHDIIAEGKVIGNAEIDPEKHELSRLVIFEPYQGKGYGTAAVRMLIEQYGISSLWVRSDNPKAIHVYEKCGFIKGGETMFQMLRKKEPEDCA